MQVYKIFNVPEERTKDILDDLVEMYVVFFGNPIKTLEKALKIYTKPNERDLTLFVIGMLSQEHIACPLESMFGEK